MSIASLGELLSVGSQAEILEQCGQKHLESASGESGIWDVPAAVAQALVASEHLDRVAEQWVATEELQRDGWRRADGLDVLSRLAELLTHRGQGQILWYWWSL